MLPEARAHKVPASERTSQKLDALLSQGVGDGDARAELLKLAVRKIVEEALEPDRSKPFVSRVRGGWRDEPQSSSNSPSKCDRGGRLIVDQAQPRVLTMRLREAG
jgi:hypothetical protein